MKALTRLLHLSDLHLPAANGNQLEELHLVLAGLGAQLIVVTGDLTRTGSRSEFGAVRRFLDRLAAPALIVPGNHDVPLHNLAARFTRPFHRFKRYNPEGVTPVFSDGALRIAGLNTARGATFSFDWSRGTVSSRDIHRIRNIFFDAPDHALRILACHHPVAPVKRDLKRSRTKGSMHALEALALMRVNVILHGHLHYAHAQLVETKSHTILQIGSTTALGDRERGDGAGFNVIDYEKPFLRVVKWRWSGHGYQPDRSPDAARVWNIGDDIALNSQDDAVEFKVDPIKLFS